MGDKVLPGVVSGGKRRFRVPKLNLGFKHSKRVGVISAAVLLGLAGLVLNTQIIRPSPEKVDDANKAVVRNRLNELERQSTVYYGRKNYES